MIHVVLYQPEIPQNTGNIMRTCAASGAQLHLIKPLGFRMDEKSLKRSGMDYRESVDFHLYDSFEDFRNQHDTGLFIYMSRYGKKAPSEFDYTNCDQEIYLVFGKESTGIDKEILKGNLEYCARLPMKEEARSLNLSNCVAICVYETLRQQGYPNLSSKEVIKGEDWLLDEGNLS